MWLTNGLSSGSKPSKCIEHASFNLQDVAHRWWRKVVKDKQEPKTWNDFKVMFINAFIPPDERVGLLMTGFLLLNETSQCMNMQTSIER